MARGLMYLVDTNIWLELLLGQEKADDVSRFMLTQDPALLFMTDFCVHSIGVILTRLKKETLYADFLTDTIENAGVGILSLDTLELKQVIDICQQFNLDFDDAYQYVAAQKMNLVLISFDGDFDGTERGRKTPAEIL